MIVRKYIEEAIEVADKATIPGPVIRHYRNMLLALGSMFDECPGSEAITTLDLHTAITEALRAQESK